MTVRIQTSQRLFSILAWAIALSLLIAACGTATPPPVAEEATEPPEVVATDPPASVPTDPPVPITEPPAPTKAPSGLDANPQRVEFQAEDGKKLVGYYYPSKYADAPIVILMHWAGGDLTDWCEIAPWLQNRADENPVKPERCANAGAGLPSSMAATWLDPSWFPAMNVDASLAVFAFDFRDYGESDKGGGGPNWKLDAKAAFATASGLTGVDATRMASIGASIGADGAADGCFLYNQEKGSGCVGAFALSPGNYLGMSFAEAVSGLAPVPTWCLSGELDTDSASACNGASGEGYRSVNYTGVGQHGMTLIAPALNPQPMELIQEFLELVFGETVKAE
jgi:hypothetical protein